MTNHYHLPDVGKVILNLLSRIPASFLGFDDYIVDKVIPLGISQ